MKIFQGNSGGGELALSTRIEIGVVADTHGLVRPELLELFKDVSLIAHAGDIGKPGVLDILRRVAPVIAVRGNADKGAWAEALPSFEVIEVAGHFLYLIHDIKTLDLDPCAAGMQAVISGHSHLPDASRKDGVLFLNPGSAGPKRFKLPVTAALLRIESSGEIVAELRDLHKSD